MAMTVKSIPSWIKAILGGLAIAVVTSSSSAIATSHYALNETRQVISKETDGKIKDLSTELKTDAEHKEIERMLIIQRIDQKLDSIQNELVGIRIDMSQKENKQ